MRKVICFALTAIISVCPAITIPAQEHLTTEDSFVIASNTVTSVYLEILDRPPDPDGLALYTGYLLDGKDAAWLRDVLQNSREAHDRRRQMRAYFLKFYLLSLTIAIFLVAIMLFRLIAGKRMSNPFSIAGAQKHWFLADRYVVIAILLLGLILTAARIHGFAFPMWHSVIDRSSPDEMLWGNPNAVRSDDWLVNIPKAISQAADKPPFSRTNRLIGDGNYNMIVTGAAPVLDITTLFRPYIWGYFISGDIGMAFEWWFKTMGLWLAIWLLLLRVTHDDRLVAFCGATALLFSPFCQAWSLNCAPSIMFAAGVLLSLRMLLSGEHLKKILIGAIAFFWTGTSLLMTVNYTPYLITLVYLVLFALPGVLPAIHTARRRIPARGLLIFAGMASVAGVGVYFVLANWTTIQTIRDSVYPGKRVSVGGDQAVWQLFRGNFISIVPPRFWGRYNASEGAGFFITFPLVMAAFFCDWLQTRRRPPWIFWCLSAYIAFILIWNIAGMPEWMALWTLMARAPAMRTLIGLGVADLLLLGVYVSTQKNKSAVSRSAGVTPWVICLAWAALHMVFAIQVPKFFPAYPVSAALAGVLPVVFIAPLLCIAPRALMPTVMLISILITFSVNPPARGGVGFVMENPVSREIKRLTHQHQDGEARWIAYDDLALPVLFRMIGVRCLNGVHAYQQAGLWRELDPHSQYEQIYNRYAHVIFSLPSNSDGNSIRLVQNDVVAVDLHPDDQRFRNLHIDYILCKRGHTNILDNISGLEKVFSYADKCIYSKVRVNL